MVLDDDDLLKRIRNNDELAMELLISKYKKLIYFRIHDIIYDRNCKNYLFDDIVQNAILLLYQCVYKFDESKGAKFSTFYNFCLDRKIIRDYTSYSKKRELLMPISLDASESEDSKRQNIEFIESGDFELRGDHYFAKNQLEEAISDIYLTLNNSEVRVCEYKFQGYSYQEIANECGCSVKKVDNTLHKFRNKLLTYIGDYDKVN